jgi:hypothetical protein
MNWVKKCARPNDRGFVAEKDAVSRSLFRWIIDVYEGKNAVITWK